MLPVQIERKRFRWLQSTGRPLSYEQQQIIDNFIVYYSTLKRYVWPPTATQSRSAMRGSWYRDISSLYQEKKDIYHDIISTIEKRNLSGYDIFLQTHFWILYHIIYHILFLDMNIPNISLNRIYILDIISLDIYPSQVWFTRIPATSKYARDKPN